MIQLEVKTITFPVLFQGASHMVMVAVLVTAVSMAGLRPLRHLRTVMPVREVLSVVAVERKPSQPKYTLRLVS